MPRHTTARRDKLRSRWGSGGCQSPAAGSTSPFCHQCVYLGQKRNRKSLRGCSGWVYVTLTWLQSSGKIGPQWRRGLYQIVRRQVCGTFSWLWESPAQWGRYHPCPGCSKKGNWASQEAVFLHDLCFSSCLKSLPQLPLMMNSDWDV